MSGVVPLLPPYVSMAGTGIIFTTSMPLYLHNLSGLIIIQFPKLPPRLKVYLFIYLAVCTMFPHLPAPI